MAKIEFKGINEYITKMSQLDQKAKIIIGHAVYEGAKVITDEIRSHVEGLPETGRKWGTENNKLTGVRRYEKEALKAGLGIATMQNDGGFMNVKVGFDGYHPDDNGDPVPIPMIARAVEKGTSFMEKNSFVKPAVGAKRAEAEKRMGETLDEDFNKIMNK